MTLKRWFLTLAAAIVLAFAIPGAMVSLQRFAHGQGVTSSPSQGPTGATGAAGSSYLSGTSGSIGGGLLSAASCSSGTATVTGATTAMTASASPVTYPGDGATWVAYVSSANTVTVKVCVLLLLTPTASTYRVRVFP